MDLLDCPDCTEQYLIESAGDGRGWICRRCQAELQLVASGLSWPAGDAAGDPRGRHLIPIGSAEARRLLDGP